MSFLQGSIDLFTGRRCAHMGSYQYVDHKGMRNGQSLSGAKLWAEIEALELSSGDTNLFRSEERLLQKVAAEIYHFLPEGTPILEMGTGTPNAFRRKTLLIMMALRSIEYICVDESRAFLEQLVSNKALSKFKVKPILDDFFNGDKCYFDEQDRDVLTCMFGSTIGNIVAPLSDAPPKEALTQHLSLIAQAMNRGRLLVSFDGDCNGEKIKAFYTKQALFQLNTLYRMAAELPIKGNFDPDAFAYEAKWQLSSGQLSHMAFVQKDMAFNIGGTEIFLKEGQCLHMKNSFKFSPAFFTECCEQAGFRVEKLWSDPSLTHVCLLKKRVHVMENPVYLHTRASA